MPIVNSSGFNPTILLHSEICEIWVVTGEAVLHEVTKQILHKSTF